jgi:flagellar biosynthesis protein FlhF
MQAKKYKAATISEAMAKIRSELGPDAMILTTNKISDLRGGHVFEITAANGDGPNDVADRNSLRQVKSELMSIKEMIFLANNANGAFEQLLDRPAVLSLYARLIKSGLADRYSRQFLARAGAFNGGGPAADKDVGKKVYQDIMQSVEVCNPFDFKDKKQVVAAFVGTTGVGKTTTVAKLAAQLMLKKKKKVGLISIDNYRIGAVEQLKAYANILGIACYPAFNQKDLRLSLNRMEKMDAVLIDTAGQSQYDTDRMAELTAIIGNDAAISTHLLLNLGASEKEMDNVAARFNALKYESYIFTKMDETEKCGVLLNQIFRRKRPIAYITNGQNVPEDIMPGNKRKIINLVFGV